MINKTLWDRILSFSIDDPHADFSFSQRLARENVWTEKFATRVMEEYKKFCYLSVVAGPCTPSDIVDQCWHLHLLYSVEYWELWCRDTLHFTLHHGPTRGGSQERVKYDEWYSRTKQLYEQEFQELPPVDIWPENKDRFQSRYVSIDVTQYFVIHWQTYPRLCRFLKWLLTKTIKKVKQGNKKQLFY